MTSDNSDGSLLDKLIATPQREKAGGETVNRFEFQTAWGLHHLLRLHSSGDDYAIAFEFHDDIMVIDSATAPNRVRFFQVKTRSRRRWTLDALLKREEGVEGLKPSIIGKLFVHRQKYPAETEHLGLVSNQPCGFLDTGNEISCFKEASREDFDAFVEGLRNECETADASDGDLFHHHHTCLPLRDYETYLKGQLADFVDQHCGDIQYNVSGFYRVLADECRRRTKKDIAGCDAHNVLYAKFITRQDVTDWLSELLRRASSKPDWLEVSTELTEIDASQKLRIRAQWYLYETKRFETANTPHSMMRDLLRNATSGTDSLTGISLRQIVENILQLVRERVCSLEPSAHDDYIRAAILYEMYAENSG